MWTNVLHFMMYLFAIYFMFCLYYASLQIAIPDQGGAGAMIWGKRVNEPLGIQNDWGSLNLQEWMHLELAQGERNENTACAYVNGTAPHKRKVTRIPCARSHNYDTIDCCLSIRFHDGIGYHYWGLNHQCHACEIYPLYLSHSRLSHVLKRRSLIPFWSQRSSTMQVVMINIHLRRPEKNCAYSGIWCSVCNQYCPCSFL